MNATHQPPATMAPSFCIEPQRLCIFLLCLALGPVLLYAETPPEQHLAAELCAEQQYRNAAIEYRRLALRGSEPQQKTGYYWGAAYAYLCDGDTELALKMLDRAEGESSAFDSESTLLRLECALAAGQNTSAAFHAQSLSQAASAPLKKIAQSRDAHIALITANAERAITLLPTGSDATESARRYLDGHDKNPRVGGLLGILPGLGYAYSGEYANALRSLLLNGLFIYAMADTAEDDDWGAFSIITFLEITWYTGSIYGGIDAAHRYNDNRLKACLQIIDNQAQYEPNLHAMPAVILKYQF
jgi:hypothetical protein